MMNSPIAIKSKTEMHFSSFRALFITRGTRQSPSTSTKKVLEAKKFLGSLGKMSCVEMEAAMSPNTMK